MPGGLATFATAAAFLFAIFAVLALWNWKPWRNNGL